MSVAQLPLSTEGQMKLSQNRSVQDTTSISLEPVAESPLGSPLSLDPDQGAILLPASSSQQPGLVGSRWQTPEAGR